MTFAHGSSLADAKLPSVWLAIDPNLLRSVHLRSIGTLVSRVHFARMALIHENVETVITGRLLVID